MLDELTKAGILYEKENQGYRLATGELLHQVMGTWMLNSTAITDDWLLTYLGRQPFHVNAAGLQQLRYYASARGLVCDTVSSIVVSLVASMNESAVALVGSGVLLVKDSAVWVVPLSGGERVECNNTLADIVQKCEEFNEG